MEILFIELVTNKSIIRQGEKLLLLINSCSPNRSHILNIFDHHFSVESYIGGSKNGEYAYEVIYMDSKLRVEDLRWGDVVTPILKVKVTPERVKDKELKQNKNK